MIPGCIVCRWNIDNIKLINRITTKQTENTKNWSVYKMYHTTLLKQPKTQIVLLVNALK